MVVLETEFPFFAQAGLDCEPPVLYFQPVAGITGICHHTQLFSIEMGVSQTFLPRLAWLSVSK
jgi:hypothetical protein